MEFVAYPTAPTSYRWIVLVQLNKKNDEHVIFWKFKRKILSKCE